MKVNYRKLFALIIAIGSTIGLLMFVLSLAGCSDAKQAQRGYAKFIRNGGTVQVKEIEVTIHDTLKINGKDSIIEKTILVPCPDPQPPKTIRETKIEYRYLRNIKKDSMEHEMKMLKERNNFVMDSLENDKKVRRIAKNDHKNELKATTKQIKIENAQLFRWFHWILFVVIAVVSLFLGYKIRSFIL